MRKTSTFAKIAASLSLALCITAFVTQPIALAGPLGQSMDKSDRQPMRVGKHALVSGQVLLDNANSGVGHLFGTPPPERFVAFRASLRIYSRGDNEFVETATTDVHGRFRLILPPGEYLIVPDLMRWTQVLAPGDANIVIVGPYQSAPALDISLKRNQSLVVTITYKSHMGF